MHAHPDIPAYTCMYAIRRIQLMQIHAPMCSCLIRTFVFSCENVCMHVQASSHMLFPPHQLFKAFELSDIKTSDLSQLACKQAYILGL